MEVVCSNCSFVNIVSSKRVVGSCQKCGLKLKNSVLDRHRLEKKKTYRDNEEVIKRRISRDIKNRRLDENFGKRRRAFASEKDLFVNHKRIERKKVEKNKIDNLESSVTSNETLPENNNLLGNIEATGVANPVGKVEKKYAIDEKALSIPLLYRNQEYLSSGVKEIRSSNRIPLATEGFVDSIVRIINTLFHSLFGKKIQEEEKIEEKKKDINILTREIILNNSNRDISELVLKKRDFTSKKTQKAPDNAFKKIFNYFKNKFSSYFKNASDNIKIYKSRRPYLKIFLFALLVVFLAILNNAFEEKKPEAEVQKTLIKDIPVVDSDKSKSYSKDIKALSVKAMGIGDGDEEARTVPTKVDDTKNKKKNTEVIKLDKDESVSSALLRDYLKPEKELPKEDKLESHSNERSLKFRDFKDNVFLPIKLKRRDSYWETVKGVRQYKVIFDFTNTKKYTYEVPAVEVVFVDINGEEVSRENVNIEKMLVANEVSSMSLSFSNISSKVANFYVYIKGHLVQNN